MKQWDFLVKKFESGSLAHAYVFSGQPTEALKSTAKKLAVLVNQTVQNAALLIEKEAFPELLMVKSAHSESSVKNEKDMMEIDIDQIRAVQQFLSYKPYYAGYKCVIIEQAERMNTEAQNCFLKSLEEPKGNTLILLLSEKPEFLLPTIFSRCQVVNFLSSKESKKAAAPEPLSQELVRVIGGDLAEKFKYAKTANLEGNNFNSLLAALQHHFRNELLAKILGDTNLRITSESTNSYSIEKLKQIIKLIETISHQAQVSNASPKLALEILLMEI